MVARKFGDLAIKTGFDAAKFILGYDPAAPVGQRFFRFSADQLAGVKGPVGDKGSVGDKGPNGDKGLTGDPGPAGTVPGPTGDKGPVGDQGLTGDKGPSGDKGIAGDKGPTGDQGTKGATGDKGLTGDKGAVGDKGATGDKGPAGDAGTATVGLASLASKASFFTDFDTTTRVASTTTTAVQTVQHKGYLTAYGVGSEINGGDGNGANAGAFGTVSLRSGTASGCYTLFQPQDAVKPLGIAGSVGQFIAFAASGGGTDASLACRFGLVENHVQASFASGVWFEHTNANVFACFINVSGVKVSVDTGIAPVTGGGETMPLRSYQIKWDANNVTWFIDGVQKHQVARSGLKTNLPMRPGISSYRTAAGSQLIDIVADYVGYESTPLRGALA